MVDNWAERNRDELYISVSSSFRSAAIHFALSFASMINDHRCETGVNGGISILCFLPFIPFIAINMAVSYFVRYIFRFFYFVSLIDARLEIGQRDELSRLYSTNCCVSHAWLNSCVEDVRRIGHEAWTFPFFSMSNIHTCIFIRIYIFHTSIFLRLNFLSVQLR